MPTNLIELYRILRRNAGPCVAALFVTATSTAASVVMVDVDHYVAPETDFWLDVYPGIANAELQFRGNDDYLDYGVFDRSIQSFNVRV